LTPPYMMRIDRRTHTAAHCGTTPGQPGSDPSLGVRSQGRAYFLEKARTMSKRNKEKRLKERCPLCGKGCRVAPDGKSGYCKTLGRWEKKMVSAAELRDMVEGPIQHQELDPFDLSLAHWSYKVVGHYLYPTLEQWELGFMRDMHATREILLWHRIAFAFIGYHRRRGLALRSDEEETQLVTLLAVYASGGKCEEEDDTARQCLKEPDGWKEEGERLIGLYKDGKDWTPPPAMADWSR